MNTVLIKEKVSAKVPDTQYAENRMRYAEMLKTPQWQTRREFIIKRDGFKCRNCGSTSNLQVHHRQYHTVSKTGTFRRPWEYKDKYLVTLCFDCHQAGHKYFTVPVFSV